MKSTKKKSLPTPPFASLVAFAHELADRSAEAVMPQFRRPLEVENKADLGRFDPVTAADKAAEEVISRLIGERFPDHGIVGEEFGSTRPEARLKWVIDPIDGTRAFIVGSPMWGTLIGLLEGEHPILGMMSQPFTGERFWSGADGAYALSPGVAKHRIRTRHCPRLADAILLSTHPDMFSEPVELDAFMRVKKVARMTRYGGDCYNYCLLASGFADVVIESGLQSYDVVALIPLIERAGGVMTSWTGGSAAGGGSIVASGDSILHEQVLELLAK